MLRSHIFRNLPIGFSHGLSMFFPTSVVSLGGDYCARTHRISAKSGADRISVKGGACAVCKARGNCRGNLQAHRHSADKNIRRAEKFGGQERGKMFAWKAANLQVRSADRGVERADKKSGD